MFRYPLASYSWIIINLIYDLIHIKDTFLNIKLSAIILSIASFSILLNETIFNET